MTKEELYNAYQEYCTDIPERALAMEIYSFDGDYGYEIHVSPTSWTEFRDNAEPEFRATTRPYTGQFENFYEFDQWLRDEEEEARKWNRQ